MALATGAGGPLYSLAGRRGRFAMPSDPTIYDLVLLLSLESDEDTRARALTDVEAAIGSGGGTLVRQQAWGRRPISYQIDHQGEAEYHLLQFSGPPALLESLSHSLGIADEVLRFRIIRVLPGTPEVSDNPPAVLAGGREPAHAEAETAQRSEAPQRSETAQRSASAETVA